MISLDSDATFAAQLQALPQQQKTTSSTMESDEEMWALPYYHGLLPREEIEDLLTRDGDFLVRKSEENPGERVFVLSVNASGQVSHVIFRHQRGMLAVDFNNERGYRTIRRFVEAHLKAGDTINSEGFVVLRHGVGRKSWELAHSTITRSESELGRGAFGVVRRGKFTDPKTKRTVHVAIKEVSQTCTKEQVKEFMNEARIMRQLDHKNVIKFYGVAAGQEPLMIVMEVATEGNLTDYLKTKRRGARSKLFMCLGAAAGLDHIHQKGIIHCSVAARNCLYSDSIVKIADFGFAHKGARKTMEVSRPVPIRWLAPETISDHYFTPKSDTWSLRKSPVVGEMVLAGERLQFPVDAPPVFIDFIVENVWNDNHSLRHSMGAVFDWLDRRVNHMND
uniref:Tyrosine-protein kinase n=1 Tax=Globodera rostochiensis TaxID=31243 RepID=A0A914I660_GLORO